MSNSACRFPIQLLTPGLATFLLLAASTVWTLRTSRAHGDDLIQDYVSARALWNGESPYLPLNELRGQAGFPPAPNHVMVHANPHPPGAILLTVPFAPFEFGSALDVIRLCQLALLAAAWMTAFLFFAPLFSV